MAWLRVAGWLVCVVYSTIPLFWLMVHPRVDHWRKRPRSPYRVLLPVWLAMWIAVALATWQWHSLLLYSRSWIWVPGILLMGAGALLYQKAGAGFSLTQLAGLPEISSIGEQHLVTTGIRSRVRHPVYLGHLCEMLGWSMGTGLLVCWALMALAIVTGALMIRMEDAELERRFGEEYASYRERVPAILPRTWSAAARSRQGRSRLSL